jgi:hypothetical protein
MAGNDHRCAAGDSIIRRDNLPVLIVDGELATRLQHKVLDHTATSGTAGGGGGFTLRWRTSAQTQPAPAGREATQLALIDRAVQAVRLDLEDAVEAGAIVLERGRGGKLDQLRWLELLFQPRIELFGDLHPGRCHGFGELERNPLDVRVERIRAELWQRGDLRVGYTGLAATGSVDVYSKRTADEHGHTGANQRPQTLGQDRVDRD